MSRQGCGLLNRLDVVLAHAPSQTDQGFRALTLNSSKQAELNRKEVKVRLLSVER